MDNKKTYEWDFHLFERMWNMRGMPCPNCVNESNYMAWYRYLSRQINKLLSADTVQTREFQEELEAVRKDEEERLARRKRLNEVADARRRRSSMERPKIDYVPKGLHIDLEEAYEKYMQQVVTFQPENKEDFLYMLRLLERWMNKSVPQLMAKNRPDAAYAIAMSLCRSLPTLIFRSDISEYLDDYKLRIGKLVYGAFEALAESVKAWNNESEREKVSVFVNKQLGNYKTYKNVQKKVLEIMPREQFVGEPVAIEREMNDEEQREYWKREEMERLRMEAEKEAKSLIPLNKDYETRIFNLRNIDMDCTRIWYMMTDENKRIIELTEKGKYQEAALLFMQLTKSMCRHFISDRHWEYFDDVYSPEYAVDDMVKWFGRLKRERKLPKEVDEYLHEAWKEIVETKSCNDYGVPQLELPF